MDLSYISWDYEVTVATITSKVELTRIPIFLGVRYNLPGEPVKVFFEGGLEVSLDEYEASLSGPIPFSRSESETNIGITPGVGISYLVSDTLLVGANARYHIIADAYFSLGVFVGFRL